MTSITGFSYEQETTATMSDRDSSSTQTTQPEPTAEELQRKKEEEDKTVADAIRNLSEQQKAFLTQQGSSAKDKRAKGG